MSSNERSLGNAIGDFLKSSRLSRKLAEQRIIDGWEKIVGPMIAKHTSEVKIQDKKLHLKVNSAPLRQELFYSREKLIQLLNAEAGETIISEIVFR
jgi:predicted nucleic acid-binding Zn ribbon protein